VKAPELLKSLPPELRRDAQIILSYLLGISPSELHIYERDIPSDTLREFRRMIQKRREGIPTAYVIGEWECMGRVFKLEEGILVPRPETEFLIEKVLEMIPKEGRVKGLELGSGSGCISVNLLLERPNLVMFATDINPKAVRVTLRNAKLHGVLERLGVVLCDLFPPFEERFDFIVSNPPYIPSSRWEELPPEVKREGRLSLVGGKRGWEFYERIARSAHKFLKEKGFIAVEIGHDQGKVVGDLFRGEGYDVSVFKDYSGYDRVIVARRWS